MSKVTTLASGHVTTADTMSVELVETIETPTVVLLRWPAAPSVSDPDKFPTAARGSGGGAGRGAGGAGQDQGGRAMT